MKSIRAYSRLTAIALHTAFWFSLRLCVRPIRWFHQPLAAALREGILSVWGLGTLWLAGVRVTVEGEPPPRPYYLVANHVTFLDIVVLSAYAAPVFVSKDEVRDWPIIGYITRKLETIYIDRESFRDTKRVNNEIAKTMEDRHGVIVFAEGGIGPGAAIASFKPSLLEPAVQAGAPVYYAAITYQTPEGCPGALEAVYWRPDVPFSEVMLQTLSLPRVYARLIFGADPVRANDRKTLAKELHEAVSARFTPLE